MSEEFLEEVRLSQEVAWKLLEQIIQLKEELKKEQECNDEIATEKVNGYDVIKMISDVKKMSMEHGGWQNAYSISHLINCIKKARQRQKERIEISR